MTKIQNVDFFGQNMLQLYDFSQKKQMSIGILGEKCQITALVVFVDFGVSTIQLWRLISF